MALNLTPTLFFTKLPQHICVSTLKKKKKKNLPWFHTLQIHIRVSQPWHYWHWSPIIPFCWGLSYALQDVKQHPGTGCQERPTPSHDNQKHLQLRSVFSREQNHHFTGIILGCTALRHSERLKTLAFLAYEKFS